MKNVSAGSHLQITIKKSEPNCSNLDKGGNHIIKDKGGNHIIKEW